MHLYATCDNYISWLMGSHRNYWWYSPLKLHYDYWLRARFRDWKWFWMWDSIMIFDLDVAIIFLSIFKAVTQLQLFLAPPPNYHKMGICNSSHKCAGRILADFWRNSSLERSVNPWSAFYVNSGLFPFSRESWRIFENLWESWRIFWGDAFHGICNLSSSSAATTCKFAMITRCKWIRMNFLGLCNIESNWVVSQ